MVSFIGGDRMLLTIYLISVIGAYLQSRRDFKRGAAEPNGMYLFMVFCPVLNTGGALMFILTSATSLFTSKKFLRKFFMVK